MIIIYILLSLSLYIYYYRYYYYHYTIIMMIIIYIYIIIIIIVVIWTDLSQGREDVGKVVTSRSLGGVMFSTLAWNARHMHSILTLGAIVPIFITTYDIRSAASCGASL